MNADEVVTAVFGNSDDAVMAVEHVFVVLGAYYGAAWGRALGGTPIGMVKTVWAHQLSQFTHSKRAKRAILWALQNLPEAVPNAGQFGKLCRSAPGVAAVLELPRPAQDPAIVAAIVNGIKAKPIGSNGMKAWADRLEVREKAGDPLSAYQRMSWRMVKGLIPMHGRAHE